MKFVQIIEYTTSKPDEVQAALDEFLAATNGQADANGRGMTTKDRDRPNTYIEHRRVPVVRGGDEELGVAGDAGSSPRR